METIPGFSMAVKTFLCMGFEQLFYGLGMANNIHLSEKQLPNLFRRLLSICYAAEKDSAYLPVRVNFAAADPWKLFLSVAPSGSFVDHVRQHLYLEGNCDETETSNRDFKAPLPLGEIREETRNALAQLRRHPYLALGIFRGRSMSVMD